MTPEEFAALHARAFEGQGRAWSAEEFAGLLTSPHVFATPSEMGFALGRAITGEAELLTIAVDPCQTRKGYGAHLLASFELESARRGAIRAFLEVSTDNTAALALYTRAGYHELSRRAGYYLRADGTSADALILVKDLP